jgi:hypothetical protein
MPYGIPKRYGGDSPANVAKMERCVEKCRRNNPGYSKASCIAICKNSIFKNKKRG